VNRAKMCLTALAGFAAMLALAATAEAQNPPAGAPPAAPPGQAAPAVNRPTIAVFNMVTVMKEYKKAKYQVYLLTEKRKQMSAEITPLKAEYVRLQNDIQIQQNPAIKEANQKKMVELGRQIEDKTRDIDKRLNDEASLVIATLYDEIKTVVDKTAEMNGYHIVFAYPDAAGPEEAKNAYMKELKLKPPAAQPFYVAKHVDITGVVVQTLNGWFPSPDPPAMPPAANPPQTGQAAPPAQPGQPAPGRP
jgi:Skp family chaperone for outer membrane proteins